MENLDDIVRKDDLLAQARHLQVRTLEILREAESTGSLRLALAAVSAARSNVETLARLLGEIGDGSTTVNVQTNVAVLQSPEWLAVRERLLRALLPYPDARIAAAVALSGARNDADVG